MEDTIQNAPPADNAYKGLIFLDAKNISIKESDLAGLNVTLGDETYEEVRASLALPISEPERYVSLRIGATKGEEREIGMIRDVNELSAGSQALIMRELRKRYFLHIIHKIISLKEKFGFLYFEAETSKGLRKFAIRWEYNRVQEYSEFGRIIMDTDDNRYIIPDLRNLSPEEYKSFTRYIYW
jgi:hypothetical protein